MLHCKCRQKGKITTAEYHVISSKPQRLVEVQSMSLLSSPQGGQFCCWVYFFSTHFSDPDRANVLAHRPSSLHVLMMHEQDLPLGDRVSHVAAATQRLLLLHLTL
jgi:hypothetical protein